MNTSANDLITDAIQTAPPMEWQRFFEDMRQELYPQIRQEDQLTELRARVMIVDEVEELFLRIRNQDKK